MKKDEQIIKLAKIVGEALNIHEEPISNGDACIELSMNEILLICERWKLLDDNKLSPPQGLIDMKDNNNMMKIKSFEMYRDGGTIEIETDRGVFCFDERIQSSTKGRLYDGYPKKDNSNLIENSDELEMELVEALKSYKNEFYQKSIDHLVKIKEVK